MRSLLYAFCLFLLSPHAWPQGNPEDLPLLSPGPHLGMIQGFESPKPSVQPLIDAGWQDALQQGMDVGRVHYSWGELEIAPGVYDLSSITSEMGQLHAQGLQLFVTLETIDSEGFTLPNDLLDPNSPTGLINGWHLDNPVIVSRFSSFLDQLLPVVVQNGGWVLSVGNEPGNYLSDNPSETSSFVAFLAAARQHAHSLEPNLAITMTLSWLQFSNNEPFLPSLRDECDVVAFNYSPFYLGWNFFNWFTMLPPSVVRQDIQSLLNFAGTKNLIFQEIGYSAGYTSSPSDINSSPAKQAEFFQNLFEILATEPRFRAGIVFQMMDWSPALSSAYANLLVTEGLPRWLADRYGEILATTGFFRFTDGSTRPAWQTFLGGLSWMQQGIGSLLLNSTPASPGQTATLTVSGAQPNSLVYIYYSLSGLGNDPAPGVSATLAISHPSLIVSLTADPQGFAQTTLSIPAPATGHLIYLQAAEVNNSSALLRWDF